MVSVTAAWSADLAAVMLLLSCVQDLGKKDKKEDSKQQYLLLQVRHTT
jgi:hypothetical protein